MWYVPPPRSLPNGSLTPCQVASGNLNLPVPPAAGAPPLPEMPPLPAVLPADGGLTRGGGGGGGGGGGFTVAPGRRMNSPCFKTFASAMAFGRYSSTVADVMLSYCATIESTDSPEPIL